MGKLSGDVALVALTSPALTCLKFCFKAFMQLSHCESQKWSNLVALSIQTEDSDSWRMWVIRIFMSFPHRFVSQLRAWFQIRLVCRVAVTTRSRCDDDDDDDDSSRAAKTKSTVAYFYSVKDFSQSLIQQQTWKTFTHQRKFYFCLVRFIDGFIWCENEKSLRWNSWKLQSEFNWMEENCL